MVGLSPFELELPRALCVLRILDHNFARMYGYKMVRNWKMSYHWFIIDVGDLEDCELS